MNQKSLNFTILFLAMGALLFPSSAFSDSFADSDNSSDKEEKREKAKELREKFLKKLQEKKKVFADNKKELKEKFMKLKAKAKKEDRVPVIIGLSTNFEPEGTLDFSKIKAQKSKIKKEQGSLLNYLSSSKADKIHRYEHVPFIAMTVDKSTLESLELSPLVATISEDLIVYPTLYDSVPLVGAPTAWSSGYSGVGQAVAILDTGVNNMHSAFAPGRVIEEACYSSTTTISNSFCPGGVEEVTGPNTGVHCDLPSGFGCGHGTHVAGIAAGNDATITGVAKDANIIAIQVFSEFNSTSVCGATVPCIASYTSDYVKGLDRVAELASPPFNIDVSSVNLSLGGGGHSSTVSCDAANPSTKASVDNLRSMGIPTIASAGNNGYIDRMGAPACISSVISVGSTTKNDVVSGFSNSASFLDLLAPGQSIYSSVIASYAFVSGTSMAAPHVTGSFGILKSASPGSTIDDILSSLKITGVPITDIRNGITKPRIQVDDAIDDLLAIPPTEVHDMSTVAFTASSATITQGDIVDLQATLTNLGNVDESSARVIYRDTTDGGSNIGGQSFSINAGDTLVGNVRQWDTSTASIGDHVLKAHVRPTIGFVDEDTSNDDMFVTVTVNPPIVIHDMRIDSFSVSPLVVTQGEIINLQATATNVGTVDEEKARINYRDTGPPNTGIAGQNFAIIVGDTFVGDVKQWDTTDVPVGTYVLKAHVRPTAGFVDNDPSNNDIFVTVTINPPSP